MKDLKNISFEDFYKKYIKVDSKTPELYGYQIEFIRQIEKAQKEGKNLVLYKGRPQNYSEYLKSLFNTAQALRNKKTVLLASLHPDKFVKDMKHYMEIDIKLIQAFKGGKPSIGNYHVKLNSEIKTKKVV